MIQYQEEVLVIDNSTLDNPYCPVHVICHSPLERETPSGSSGNQSDLLYLDEWASNYSHRFSDLQEVTDGKAKNDHFRDMMKTEKKTEIQSEMHYV